jgi:hypothetical protein
MHDRSEGPGAGWNRREFVTAIGAGVVAATTPHKLGMDTLIVRFHGAMLVTRISGTVEILIPKAEGSGTPNSHPDTHDARKHYAHLSLYELYPRGWLDKHLRHKHVTLTSEAKETVTDLQGMFDLGCGLPPVRLRAFEKNGRLSEHYATRVTLKGGTLRAIRGPSIGSWQLAPSMTSCQPQLISSPASSLEWHPGTQHVTVDGIDDELVSLSSNHCSIEIGHQPVRPKEWHKPYPKKKLKKCHIDHDFKWLYEILIPETVEDDEKPWKGVSKEHPLPAPTYVDESKQVDSPTCFGGCWNC